MEYQPHQINISLVQCHTNSRNGLTHILTNANTIIKFPLIKLHKEKNFVIVINVAESSGEFTNSTHVTALAVSSSAKKKQRVKYKTVHKQQQKTYQPATPYMYTIFGRIVCSSTLMSRNGHRCHN